jgi:hypothetical protein
MLDRRGLFLRAAVAAVSGSTVSPSEALALIPAGLPPRPEKEIRDDVSPTDRQSGVDTWEIAEELFWRRDAETLHADHMHPSIAGKKSWSHAYKAHVHAQDAAEERRIRQALGRDKELREKLGKLLRLIR